MAKMTTKKIEEKGQRILCDYFSECDRVDTYVSINEKEPIWDGHLYLFNSSEQKAEHVYGRIPIQLKSTNKSSSKDTASFRVKRTALESYKRDGGIIYFYILNENPSDKQIYYCLLTPVIIKKYLRAPNQKADVAITLKQITADKHRITEELFQFFFDCKKQTASADKPIVEIQDYFSKAGERKFSFFAKSSKPVDDVFKLMQEHPLYLYATDGEQNITYAIGDGPVSIKIGRNIEEVVSVEGVPYFKGCTLFEEGGESVITIGNFFTFRTGTEESSASISFKLKGTLNIKKIPYLAFTIAVLKHKKFSIGKLNFSCSELNPNPAVVERMNEELKILNQVQSLFTIMHIVDDINLKELNASEINNLEALYKGIVLKEPLELKEGMEKNVRIQIGPLVLYVMFEKNDDGTFLVHDFFMDDDVCCLLTENEVTTKSSRFTLLSVEQFAEASNFDFSMMIASYEHFIKDNEKVAEYANLDMLRMILAFDKTGGKKRKLLDAAETLNNWFIQTGMFSHLPINEINSFQIKKRIRALTEKEVGRIYEMLDSELPEDYKTACMLLLDNQAGAEYHFKKIQDEQKDFFKTLPIYHFWKQ